MELFHPCSYVTMDENDNHEELHKFVQESIIFASLDTVCSNRYAMVPWDKCGVIIVAHSNNKCYNSIHGHDDMHMYKKNSQFLQEYGYSYSEMRLFEKLQQKSQGAIQM